MLVNSAPTSFPEWSRTKKDMNHAARRRGDGDAEGRKPGQGRVLDGEQATRRARCAPNKGRAAVAAEGKRPQCAVSRG